MTTILHSAGDHHDENPVTEAITEGERDVERTLGEHESKIEHHENALTEMRSDIEGLKSSVSAMMDRPVYSATEMTEEVAREVERVFSSALDAVEEVGDANEETPASEEVLPPPPVEEPKRESGGIMRFLRRLG